jgi:serine phosphatase RsbU (regulator of sigma subunit)
VLVADVTGHGVPAALIASMVKVALASQQSCADRPAQVLTGINRALCGRLAGRYVTAAYLFIDDRAGIVRYAAAGHPPMLQMYAARRVRRIEENGVLLGFLEDADYADTELRLEGHDRFLLYTDGLIEAANRSDDFFGIEGVEDALASAASLAAAAAADAVLAAKEAWSGLPPTDDLTLVVIDRSHPPHPDASHDR